MSLDLGSQTEGIILSETGDHDCVVLSCASSDLTVRLSSFVQLGDTPRLAFQRPEGMVRVLARWVGMDRDELGMELRCQMVALHSTAGRGCLEGFLADIAGEENPSGDGFQAGAGGIYYRFASEVKEEASTKPSYERTSGPVDHSERREARVAVRAEVQYRVDGEETAARAYNVSVSGLYILSDEALPPIGTAVEVSYPIPLHDRPLQATLYGDIVWVMDSMSAGQGGGLGIRLTRIDDGASGGAWREYVAREASFDDAIPLTDNP